MTQVTLESPTKESGILKAALIVVAVSAVILGISFAIAALKGNTEPGWNEMYAAQCGGKALDYSVVDHYYRGDGEMFYTIERDATGKQGSIEEYHNDNGNNVTVVKCDKVEYSLIPPSSVNRY